MALLEIRNLAVEFATARGAFRAVDGVDVTRRADEVARASSANPAPARACRCSR